MEPRIPKRGAPGQLIGVMRIQIKENGKDMGEKKKGEEKEKPLEKMTAKDLREIAMEISEITGAHGMNKAELVAAIKKARGIEDKDTKSKDASVREIKQKIRELKQKRETALTEKDSKTATILRRKISRLKKRTRAAA